jgi:LmbE family N-acetylglucosaminyl deacetylase
MAAQSSQKSPTTSYMSHVAKPMKTLLAIFAHPDDETFRPGGTLALLARRGVRVQVLTATRGGAGSYGEPLGIEPPILLEYQDGHLADVNPETMVAEIQSVVAAVQPQVMLTFGPDGLSGHPDHIAIGQFATETYRLSGDVNALYTLAVPQSLADALGMSQIHALPDETITLSVNVSETWEAKMKAIQCHATQLGSSPITRAPLERQRLFLGTEYFVRAARRGGWDFFSELVTES